MEKILALPNIIALDSNNILDKEILTENIFILIPDYTSKAIGDEVTFFFGAKRTQKYLITQDNINKPIIIEYLPDSIPVDTYQVYYTITDVAHNTGVSPSLKVSVIDHRTEITLEAPTLEGETSDGILYLSELSSTITMDIPAPQSSLVAGDEIYGFIGDKKSIEHLVFVELDEHKIKFSKDTFTDGEYSIYYTRTRNGNTIKSKEAMVKFVTQKPQPTAPNLNAPKLPNAINGVIDLTDLTEGVIVLVPPYDAISGDSLEVTMGPEIFGPYIIKSSGISPDPYVFTYPEKDIAYLPLEVVEVYYYVNRDGVKYKSPVVQVKFTRDLSLRAPELECVEKGVLDLSHCPDTLTLTVPHYDAAKGDVINAWIGSYQAVPHYVVQNELDVHTLKFTTNKISTGQQDVYYKVTRNSEEYRSPSLAINVIAQACPQPDDTINRILRGDPFNMSTYYSCENFQVGVLKEYPSSSFYYLNIFADAYPSQKVLLCYFKAYYNGCGCYFSFNGSRNAAIACDQSVSGEDAIIEFGYNTFSPSSLLPIPEKVGPYVIFRGNNGYYLKVDDVGGGLLFSACRQQASKFNIIFS